MVRQGENQKPKVLLVGDVDSAFVTPDAAGGLKARKCSRILDAVELASKEDFDLIGVVMSGAATNLESALKSLRQAGKDAKIILLARMYHEPLAMKFVQGDREGRRLADDYLSCPVVAWTGPRHRAGGGPDTCSGCGCSPKDSRA
jgi:hypothetical protein